MQQPAAAPVRCVARPRADKSLQQPAAPPLRGLRRPVLRVPRDTDHILEVDISLEELADILGEELQLPRIEPKGKHTITAEKERYSGIRQSGPESLRHFKRTFKQALRRQLMSGAYNPERPVIIPVRQDRRMP